MMNVDHMIRTMVRTARHARVLKVLVRCAAFVLMLHSAVAFAQDAAVATPDSVASVTPATQAVTGFNPRPVVATRKVRLLDANTVVRSGPGDSFSIAGIYGKDAEFPVIAKSGPWYNVRLSPSETAWVHSSLCEEHDDVSDLEFRPNPKLYTRTGTFIVGGYGGAYAFDRKSNSFVAGGRLGYYVFDRLQVEGGLAWTHIHRSAEIVESLFDLSLEAEDFHMLFYNLNLAWELLPGRQMVPYVTAGVGNSIMRGESEPSINFGGGTSLFISKRAAVRWDVRDHRLDVGSGNSRVRSNNVEFTLGTTFLF